MNARDPQASLPSEHTQALAAFADRRWDEAIVPALTDYIAVPAKSPMFDAEWASHGFVDRVVAAQSAPPERSDRGRETPAQHALGAAVAVRGRAHQCLDRGLVRYSNDGHLRHRIRNRVTKQPATSLRRA